MFADSSNTENHANLMPMTAKAPKNGSKKAWNHLSREVNKKAQRRTRAARRREHNVWFGLGTFGAIGWSVSVPTLIGTAIGAWLDTAYPGRFSWTLMLLALGVIVGSLNAWFWVSRQLKTIRHERDEEGAEDD